MNKSGLWNAGFGKIGATLKSLEDAGVTTDHLATIRSDGELAKKIADLCRATEPSDIKSVWTRIYKRYFNRRVNLADVVIPDHYDPKKHFCIIAARGITLNEVVKGLRKLFTVHLYTEDLDANVTANDRIADKDYAILFRKNIEADEEFKNLSANQLKEKGISGITLLERLLLEALYFSATLEHLDVSNVTLCSGSRFSDGHVPYVLWDSVASKLVVHWYSPDDSSDYLRARVAV